MEPFANSLEHVLAEIERVDLFLQLQVHRARHRKRADDRPDGLDAWEHVVDALCAEPAGLPRWAGARVPWPEDDVQRALGDAAARIAERAAASVARGVSLRLPRLAALFGLDRFDIDVLLVCLAPEIDLRYERLFAHLAEDGYGRQLTVDLVLDLLCPTFTEKLAARARFSHTAPLVQHRLVALGEDLSRPRAPLLGRHVTLEARIAGFLLGSNELDAAISPYARLVSAAPERELPIASPEVIERIDAIVARAARGPLLVHLQGPPGVGKRAWAAEITARRGAPLLVVDGERVAAAAEKQATVDAVAQLAAREALLQGAAIYWDGFDALLAGDRWAQGHALIQALSRHEGLTFVAGAAEWNAPGGAAVLRMQIPRPTHAERVQLWRRVLDRDLDATAAAELPALSAKFRLTGGEILAAAEEARERARLRGPDGSRPSIEELYAACRARSSSKLHKLAKKIRPHYTFGDLVLPADGIRQLREICEQVRLRAHVLEAWGFEQKLSLGRGINVLFSGPSGTGKTMAADILAGELGIDLYKIDLSGVVSKYIGETEKNLARVFDEAENSSAILFFDEADALFGKRSEVKDAHDRYANVETSFLLQRMEEYDGITILATNLRRNLDDAFARRMAFTIQFPSPEEPYRLRIWQRVFPTATPLGDDVDLAFMAKQFKLTGGNVKNIALAAAFLAASDRTKVSMAHIIRATRRELQKMGQSPVPAEFGAYAGMLEA